MPAEEEKKPHPNAGRAGYRIPEERYVAARVLYESQPGATFKSVADEVGVSYRALEERSKQDGGWNKVTLLPPTDMSEAAQQVADNYASKLEDYGGQDLTPETKHQAMVDTAVDKAVSVRAQLLDRHRREWAGPRALAYESMKKRDFELAKLAKINSETLRNIQDGERKAYGLDPKDTDKPSMVVIERD